jgi:hypothetical protein
VGGVEQGHIFHDVCIQGWINANVGQIITCPLCRAPLVVEVLEELPVNFWNPINIILNGSLIAISSVLVIKFVISLQKWAEYNHASSIELAALQQYAGTLERYHNTMGLSSASSEMMGNLTMNKYEIIGIVGEGAYGVVYKAKSKETGEFGNFTYFTKYCSCH